MTRRLPASSSWSGQSVAAASARRTERRTTRRPEQRSHALAPEQGGVGVAAVEHDLEVPERADAHPTGRGGTEGRLALRRGVGDRRVVVGPQPAEHLALGRAERAPELGRRLRAGGGGAGHRLHEPGGRCEPPHDLHARPRELAELSAVTGACRDERRGEVASLGVDAFEVERVVAGTELGPEHVEQHQAVEGREERTPIGDLREQLGRGRLVARRDRDRRRREQLVVAGRIRGGSEERQLREVAPGSGEVAGADHAVRESAPRDAPGDGRSPVDAGLDDRLQLFQDLVGRAEALRDHHLDGEHAVAHQRAVRLGHPVDERAGLLQPAAATRARAQSHAAMPCVGSASGSATSGARASYACRQSPIVSENAPMRSASSATAQGWPVAASSTILGTYGRMSAASTRPYASAPSWTSVATSPSTSSRAANASAARSAERERVLGVADRRRDRLGEDRLGLVEQLGVEQHHPASRERRVLLVRRPHELVAHHGDRLVAGAGGGEQPDREIEVALCTRVPAAAPADVGDALGRLALEDHRRDHLVELPGAVGARAGRGARR